MTNLDPTARCRNWREAILGGAFFALLTLTPFVI